MVPDLFKGKIVSHQSQNISTAEFFRSPKNTDCLPFCTRLLAILAITGSPLFLDAPGYGMIVGHIPTFPDLHGSRQPFELTATTFTGTKRLE